jgi:predicted ATPase/DNA-binding winged helix-turn-helix (wHTH) protein
MHIGAEIPASVTFGRFQVSPLRRELLADGRRVEIGGRAFDVLIALIEARGSVISKGALMARVWPDRIVEENNLQIQISTLRAVLGTDRDLIRTVPGRGYQFTGDIRIASADLDTPYSFDTADRQLGPPPANVPESISELIGRNDELRDVLGLIETQRLVTLTGPGGIGKTRLALAAARHLLPRFPDGVWVVELAPLSDPELVPSAVAAAFGLDLAASGASADHVARALGQRELLLLIDNCEHVIGGVAAMAEALLHADSAAHVVTTSRELLKADGEWSYRVPPLTVPEPDIENEDDLVGHGAVRLFLTRAQAVEPHFLSNGHLTATIAAICRRLDGIPLAIELAAARTATLDIEHIAARLDDRFGLLAGGRRTAMPRQQAMHATLEWSHELLTAPERVVLRRLAVFAGIFDLEAAAAVAASPDLPPSEVIDVLASLVSKSLVDRNATRYRLLETTRAFALEKLIESGEREAVSLRHAEYHQGLFERAEVEWQARPAAEWLADYAPKIDNARAALDWAFSPGGNPSVGVALTAAAVPLWMQLSLLQECRSRVKRALLTVEAGASGDLTQEMKLQVALGASTLYSKGRAQELGAVWTRALQIAELLGDRDYQLRSLRGMFISHTTTHHWRAALEIAQKFRLVAEHQPDRNDHLLGEGLVALAQLYLGDQTSARAHVEHMLANFAPGNRSHYQAIRFQFDQRVSGVMTLARILWQQGLADQAMRTAESAVEDALETNHAVTACNALFRAACPIALWTGDLAAGQRHVKNLLELAKRYSLPLWNKLGRMYEGSLAIRRGDVAGGLRLLRANFDELGKEMPVFDQTIFQSEIAEGLRRAGNIAEGSTVVEQAIDRCERIEERWLFAELLRLRGELLLLSGKYAKAEDSFREAIDSARQQGALSWELRAATSLGRLLRDQGRHGEARTIVQSIYDQFTEGFRTADLGLAKMLIKDL